MQIFDFHFDRVNFKMDKEEKKDKKGESTDILKIIEYLTKIFTFIGIVLLFLTKYINYFHALESSDYYGIPISYFIEDPLTDSFVLKILFIAMPFIIFLMPAILIVLFKISTYDKFEVKILSFANSLLLLVFFIDIIVNLVYIIAPNSSNDFKLGLSFVIFLIIALLLTSIYYKFYESVITITNNNIFSNLLNKNKKDNSDVKEEKDKDKNLNSKDIKENDSQNKDVDKDSILEEESSSKNPESEGDGEDTGKIKPKKKEKKDYKTILIIAIVIFFTFVLFKRSVTISDEVKVEKKFNSAEDHNFEIIIKNKDQESLDAYTLDYSYEDNNNVDSDVESSSTYYDEMDDCEQNCGLDYDYSKEDGANNISRENDYIPAYKDKLYLDLIVIRKDKNAVTIKGYIKDNKLHILKGQYRMEDIENKDIINIKSGEAELVVTKIEDLINEE